MAHITFTRTAAQAKVGKRVRTRVVLGDVPPGAIGTILRADRVIDGYDVEVAWVWPGRRMPWIDWVTKADYDVYLMELPEPRDGRPPSRSRAAPAGR